MTKGTNFVIAAVLIYPLTYAALSVLSAVLGTFVYEWSRPVNVVIALVAAVVFYRVRTH